MAFQSDVVSGEQYRYALQNFRIAHEKVEDQRKQLQEQERQVAELRAHIAVLEGDDNTSRIAEINARKGGQSVDDFSIKNAASRLEKQISRWAADVIRNPPKALEEIRAAVLDDLDEDAEEMPPATELQTQNLLRHALSETISESIINCLIITNSTEANVQLTRIHEHLFARDPTVACVWRRQTFTAAVEAFSPEMSEVLLKDSLPALLDILSTPHNSVPPVLVSILDSAFGFSRMLHGSKTGPGGKMDAFYKAFVPDLGTPLDPHQVELVKRCLKAEQGELDHVGSCIFPGLVKITGGLGPNRADTIHQTVMKRALVMCGCALGLSDSYNPANAPTAYPPQVLQGASPGPPPGPPPPDQSHNGDTRSYAGSPPPNVQNGTSQNGHQYSQQIPNLPNPHYGAAAPRPAETGQYPTEAMEGLTLVHGRS